MANPIIETVAQAAARLGVTTRTINRRIQKGTMAGIKLPSPGRNSFINLLFTPSEPNESDVYRAAQDLGERLARQIELNQALRAVMNDECIQAHKLEIELAGAREEIGKLQNENTALASRPCLACDLVHPPLHERRLDLEAHFEKACELLNQIDADTVGLTYGSIVSFIRDRRKLNAARIPAKGSNSPV